MELSIGNVYLLTFARKRNGVRVEETFAARLSWSELREAGIYFGYAPLEPHKHGSFGAASIYSNGPKPFGLQRIEDTGRAAPRAPSFDHGWMVRHPGYDSVH